MKKCPFCKNEIKITAEQCPICKRTLIEKVSYSKTSSERTYTPPPPKSSAEKARTYYESPKSSYSSNNKFKMPKINGWVISIVGSILLSMVLSGVHGSSNPLPTPVPETTNTDLQPIDINKVPQKITADFKPMKLIPLPHAPYYSLPNGTVLFSDESYLNGSGILTISNGSGSDALVKLITNSGNKVYHVYVRSNNSYSIQNISDGTYRLAFEFGSNWDTEQEKFLVDPNAESFDDTFIFTTTVSENGNYTDREYTRFKITLNPVINGKATTSPLDPSEFDKY